MQADVQARGGAAESNRERQRNGDAESGNWLSGRPI
jgi:hypothetical protein